MGGGIDERKEEWMSGKKDGRVEGGMDVWKEGWKSGRKDG